MARSLVSVLALFAFSSVHAHQRVIIPAPTFTTDRITATNPLAFLENQGIKASADHVPYFTSLGIKTLRHFMDNTALYKADQEGATFECGYTDPEGTRQAIPSNGMMRSTGFTHDGPCEVWIDKTRVLGNSTANCHETVGHGMVSYEIDFSVCKGDCMIHWYWFAKRLIGKKYSWQVYKECIPIRGDTAAGTVHAKSDDDTVA